MGENDQAEQQHIAHEHVHHEPHLAHTHSGNKFVAYAKKHKAPIIATFIYFVFALVVFYPVAIHMGTTVPGIGGDAYQNLFFLWWAKYAVFNLHTNVFYTSLLYAPLGSSLTYQTLAPLLGVISAPIQLLSIPLAYDLVFFVGFALSGLGMYLLADYLVKNSKAAFLAGIIFAFSAFHIAQAGHIHFINIEWAPLFAYFLIKILEEKGNYWNVIGLAATFALSTLASNVEISLIIIWLLPLIVVCYLATKDNRKKVLSWWFLISMVLFVVLAFIIGSWNFIPIINALHQSGAGASANYLNTPQYNAIWSDNLLAFFLPSYYNGIAYATGISSKLYGYIYTTKLFTSFSSDPTEKAAYIGYSVLVLVIYGLYKSYKGKELKAAMPWIVGAIIFGWLALGPMLQVGSYISSGANGLYSLYHAIPLISVVREPGRFQLLFTMCIAVLAAFGFRELDKWFINRKGDWKMGYKSYALAGIFAIIIMAELAGVPLGMDFISQISTRAIVPVMYKDLANFSANFTILSLPTLPVQGAAPNLYSGEATYYTSVSHKQLVGGDLGGRENSTNDYLLYNLPLIVQDSDLLNYGLFFYGSPVQENYTNQTILALYNYNTAFIVLQKDAYNSTDLNLEGSYLYSTFGPPIYNDNTSSAFSTSNTIARSVYRSFVAFPLLQDWNQSVILINGSYVERWTPQTQGAIVLYAPYANTNDIASEVSGSQIYYINTSINFIGESAVPQKVYIAQPLRSGNYTILEEFNLTNSEKSYNMSVKVASGPIGNSFFFLSQYTNEPVYLQNITFSRAEG